MDQISYSIVMFFETDSVTVNLNHGVLFNGHVYGEHRVDQMHYSVVCFVKQAR